MNYYADKFREHCEMIDCWCWVLKWIGLPALLLWLGSKL